MEKDDIKEINPVSARDVAKEMQDNQLSRQDKDRFIESIMDNYYLDNDNINFLEDNGYSFFKLLDTDQCFCLSGLEFQTCCKLKMQPAQAFEHISYEKSLTLPDEFEYYKQKMQKLFLKHYEIVAQAQQCALLNCKQAAVESQLYDKDFKAERFYATNKINPLDSFFKMGENFFEAVTPNNFKFYGFCAEHSAKINSITLTSSSSDIEIIQVHLKAILFKLFNAKVCLAVSKEDFINNFNSIKEEGYKAIYIYRLKKLANQMTSLEQTLTKYLNNLDKNQEIKIIKWELSRQKNFEILDLMYPQICPSDFQVVNSVNNVFVNESPVSICVNETNKKTVVTIAFDRSNKKLITFFHQYLLIIDEKEKNQEFFTSNCALILADNIIFSAKFFEKLTNDEQVFLSALNKFRYENPTAGHEYVKMQFFAGFTKGNDFFK